MHARACTSTHARTHAKAYTSVCLKLMPSWSNFICTQTPTHSLPFPLTDTHRHSHTHTLPPSPTHRHTPTHTHSQTQRHTQTLTHTLTPSPTHRHTPTHTHSQTHRHTQALIHTLPFPLTDTHPPTPTHRHTHSLPLPLPLPGPQADALLLQLQSAVGIDGSVTGHAHLHPNQQPLQQCCPHATLSSITSAGPCLAGDLKNSHTNNAARMPPSAASPAPDQAKMLFACHPQQCNQWLVLSRRLERLT